MDVELSTYCKSDLSLEDVELSTYCKNGLSLEKVLELPLTEETIGLFYTPNQCFFGRRKAGKICDAQDKEIALAQIFEARLFDSTVELRWLRDPGTDGLGQAVYLFDDHFKPSFEEGWEKKILDKLKSQENHYLLWGKHWDSKAANLANGWACLAASRIGELFVPVPDLKEKEQRVRLKTREYFGLPCNADGSLTLAGQHGNQVVVEERWLNLEICDVSHKGGECA
jgi:CRISPR-associated protein (TIGR03984 family)